MGFSDKCKRDSSTGLFRGLTLSAAICAAALAPITAGAAEYTEGMDSIVLMAGSADGTTNTLAEAIAAYNTANGTSYDISSFNGGDLAAYALVKEGDGTLVMDTAIQSYTGPIVIKDGVVQCMCTEALGADVDGSHVYVRNGATLWVDRQAIDVIVNGKTQKQDSIFNQNRTLHIIGSGHNNQGALASRPFRPNSSYNQSGIYCKKLYLDGDASVMHPVWGYVANNLWLKGYTLNVYTVYTSSSKTHTDATWLVASIEDNGKIVMDESILYFTGFYFKDATEGNEIEVGENSGFRFWASNFANKPGRKIWRLNFTGNTGWLWGDDSSAALRFHKARSELRNWIANPMILNGTTVKMNSQGNVKTGWTFIEGPVSGTGGFDIAYINSRPAARLSLLNPQNSFTGGVRVDRGLLYVYEPGSLPSASQLTVERTGPLNHGAQKDNLPLMYHGVEFISPEAQTLGQLTFTSVANSGEYYSGRIQGGSGTFSQIDKQSPNTMEYYSGIGSPLLNVEGGTVKLPRGPAPGLWEGTNKTANIADLTGDQRSSNWHAAFTALATSTNMVALGPNLMNDLWYSHFGSPFDSSRAATYDGYIWNRDTTNVTWTFAASILQYACVRIDGAQRIYHSYISDSNHQSPAQQFVQIQLTPGSHKIMIRACCSSVKGDNVTWPKNFGFAYDNQGRNVNTNDFPDGNYSSISNNFKLVLDPGDGSLFTRSIDEADLPHFDEMRFAPGTTLDLNGNAYVASTFSGFPNVISSAEDASAAPSLTVTNRFVVNAADLVEGRKLSLDMPFTLGSSSGVDVTNLTGVSRRKYTLVEVSGEGNEVSISGRSRVPCTADYGKWVVLLSDDGKKLELCPASGFILHLR